MSNDSISIKENIFKLSGKELSERIVDWVDIAADTVEAKDYKEVDTFGPPRQIVTSLQSEDPKLFKSAKTGRGPLAPGWQTTSTSD